MPKKTMKILATVIIAIMLLSASTVLAAGTKTSMALAASDANLHFELGDDIGFIYGTVTDDALATVDIPLSVYYDNPVSGNKILGMYFTIIYPNALLTYVTATSENWPIVDQNDFVADHIAGDVYDTINITFADNAIDLPSVATVFAHLQFHPLFQKEGLYSDVAFYVNGGLNCYAFIGQSGGSAYYPPEGDHLVNGKVTIDNYIAIAKIDADTTDYLGAEVEIPVYYWTNFLLHSIHDEISYNNTKLQYLPSRFTYNSAMFPNGLSGSSTVYNTGTSIHINLRNPDNFNSEPKFSTEKWPDSIWAYKLYFRIIRTTPPNDTAQLGFLDLTNSVPLVADKYAWTFTTTYNVWNDGIDHSPGKVTIPDYQAYLEAPRVAGTTIKKHEGNIDFSVRMQNQFPAGMANINSPGAIRINFDMGVSEWVYLSKPAENSSIQFDKNDYESAGHTWVTFKQKYLTGTGLNWWVQRTSFDELFKMRLQYQGPTTYTDNHATLSFAEIYPDPTDQHIAQVADTTGNFAAIEDNTKLHWTNVTYDVELGGFHAPSVTSQNVTGSQPLYIRWNFNEPITAFSVQVNCPRVTRVVAYPESGVHVEGESGVYTVSYSGTPGMTYPGSGELVRIATIYYGVSCPYAKLTAGKAYPEGPYYSSATVSLTNPSITSPTGAEWAVTDTSTVTGLCPGFTPRDEEELIDRDPLTKEGLPTEFQLHQNHPNPFNPETIISYDVPRPTQVKIVVMNILGQEVATLLDEQKPAGRYEVIWRGTDNNGARVSSGIYLCVMRAGSFQSMVKMSLMK